MKTIEKVFELLNRHILKIKLFLVLFSITSLIVIFSPQDTYKEFGSLSWFFLIAVMFIRPLHDIFPKCRIFSFLLKLRREMGILVGVFGITHALGFLISIGLAGSQNVIFGKDTWSYSSFLFWGILGVLVSIPLLITSNGYFIKILGKNWKTLQRLSYLMFIFVGLHISMIDGFEIGELVPVFVWIILFVIAHFKNKKAEINIKAGPKWLCVPCGYIYDENVGDPDSGILPGTKFEDIPDSWRCPVCFVGKSDFILIKGDSLDNNAKITKITYLTKDVIELIINVGKDLKYTAGQFLNFNFEDDTGKFSRSYSIANKIGNEFVFLIKIKEEGRAGKIFKNIKKGDNINYSAISGSFTLKDSLNPKVFIATGTGLAPIYSMLLNSKNDIKKKLYFGLANKEDLFYIEELKNIKNLDLEIFISRENVEGYHFGRIDLQNESFEENTEFYICGNPGVTTSTINILKQKGFVNVYSESFGN